MTAAQTNLSVVPSAAKADRTHILNLSCMDRPGIVARVTTSIAAIGGNIAESAQYWDRSTDRFFMRIAFTAPAEVGPGVIQGCAEERDRPVRHGVHADRRRPGAADPGAGLALRPLPASSALPDPGRLAQGRGRRHRVQPRRQPHHGRATWHSLLLLAREPRREGRAGSQGDGPSTRRPRPTS